VSYIMHQTDRKPVVPQVRHKKYSARNNAFMTNLKLGSRVSCESKKIAPEVI